MEAATETWSESTELDPQIIAAVKSYYTVEGNQQTYDDVGQYSEKMQSVIYLALDHFPSTPSAAYAEAVTRDTRLLEEVANHPDRVHLFSAGTSIIASHDYGEDFDDFVAMKCLACCLCNVTIIVSGGHISSQQRLDILSRALIPGQSPFEFNVPVDYGQCPQLIFLSDDSIRGGTFPDVVAAKAYLNCGPVSSQTLTYIAMCLESAVATGHHIVVQTVGAIDGTGKSSGVGINQLIINKDPTGNPFADKAEGIGIWDAFIHRCNATGMCRVQNLSVLQSRFVKLPYNEETFGFDAARRAAAGGTKSQIYKSRYAELAHGTRLKFMGSRPPVKFGARVNLSNTQILLNIFPGLGPFLRKIANPAVGFETIVDGLVEDYATNFHERIEAETLLQRINLGFKHMMRYGNVGLGPPASESATQIARLGSAVPLMVTTLLGGVYRPGLWGGPATAHLIDEMTQFESLDFYIDAKIDFLTPPFDAEAYINASECVASLPPPPPIRKRTTYHNSNREQPPD